MSGDLTDALVIAAIKGFGPRAMTYVIANILDRKWPTAKIRRHLKGMERRGLVERVSTGYAAQICWALKGCDHVWRVRGDGGDLGGGRTEVVCVKCDVPGDRNDDSGEVFWPAT